MNFSISHLPSGEIKVFKLIIIFKISKNLKLDRAVMLAHAKVILALNGPKSLTNCIRFAASLRYIIVFSYIFFAICVCSRGDALKKYVRI